MAGMRGNSRGVFSGAGVPDSPGLTLGSSIDDFSLGKGGGGGGGTYCPRKAGRGGGGGGGGGGWGVCFGGGGGGWGLLFWVVFFVGVVGGGGGGGGGGIGHTAPSKRGCAARGQRTCCPGETKNKPLLTVSRREQ